MASGSTDLLSPLVSPVSAVPEEPGVPESEAVLESEAITRAPARRKRRDSEDDTPLDMGPWIKNSTKTSGSGASTVLV